MKLRIIFYLLALFFSTVNVYSQKTDKYTWWNSMETNINFIEGQAWPNSVNSKFDRLPIRAENLVRKPLWNLSKHAAGLSIRFFSDAKEIIVKYKVNGNYAMPHMPTTGVSGVDLYAKNGNGEWKWYRGNYSFNDTIVYHYKNINPKEQYHNKGREYQLFLPLYNSINSLKIGFPKEAEFKILPVRKEKPIVVYGTSIAQGACASRSGMAWTNILQRKMDRPIINLAFSGNGRLESELIDLITEIDAKIYVLDCLPNLTPNKTRTIEEVYQRIISSVETIRQKRPNVPILLVEHGGYSDGRTNAIRAKAYKVLNKTMQKAFLQLKTSGITKLYTLKNKEIGLGMESFVDGTHPTDVGMIEYANAYEIAIRSILKEPKGILSTTIPVTQAREPGNYSWENRHQQILQSNKDKKPTICLFGDSITHFWGGQPDASIKNGEKSWKKAFDKLNIQNFGFGWDRLENVLWRIYHDELDHLEAEKIVLMIGTNNLDVNTNDEITQGLKLIIEAIKERQPNSKIILASILPRKQKENRIRKLNQKLYQLSNLENVNFVTLGAVLLKEKDQINSKYFLDGLHPNEKGYKKIAKLLLQHLTK